MLHEIYDEGLCPLRYRHQACIQSLEEFRECVENGEFKHGVYKDPKRLALGPLKLFKDGSLGGRTAAMRKDTRTTRETVEWNVSQRKRWTSSAVWRMQRGSRW